MKIHKAVKRFDLGEMRKAEKTPQGFLKVPGFATRVGVFPYLDGDGQMRRELRHPDDVFDPVSLATLKYAPVTIEHPPVMLTPENVGEYAKGHTTEKVEVNRDMVDVDLIIEQQDAIDAVEKEGIRELSSGYLADIIEEDGVFNGAPYNYRQKNIRYNHLAMVKRGRAGPEVRMRLDSKDAVMSNNKEMVPIAGEFSQESSVNDSEQKQIVIAGKEVSLPSETADIVQEILDRYDEMRAEISQLKEKHMAKRNDMDISQKGVSPQVKVEQQGPDGKSASGKIGPGEKTVHPDAEDVHGAVGGVKPNSAGPGGKAMDAEEDDKKDGDQHAGMDPQGHEDFAAAPAAQGGGAAMSPVDQMKKDLEEAHAKLDALQGKYDAMASASMGAGEAHPDRMDSVEKRIRARTSLVVQASKLVPHEIAQKFDSMSDSKIRAAVIKHTSPHAEVEGKSDVYLQSRFDSIVEANLEASAEGRRKTGREMMGVDERFDLSPADEFAARRKMVKESSELWKTNLSGYKK